MEDKGGIPWSGGDVTKMPIIGTAILKPILSTTLPGKEIVRVVEIVENGEYYIINKWYKEYKRIPRVIHRQWIEEYVPVGPNNKDPKKV